MEPLLRAEHITICYSGVPAVRDVSFTVQEGEILGIVGESGSGKSTLIKAVMGLLGSAGAITGGDLWFQGKPLIGMPEKERRRLSGPQIGMIFQDCKAALCPVRTIGAQIHEALREHEKVSKKTSFSRAAELMKKIGLTDCDRVLNSYPFELSGGMNQRVGICTAMLMNPALLLADEPTSALDVTVQKQVVEEMLLMRREYGTAMILVTHNIGVVRKMADQVLVLRDGAVVEYGGRRSVLEHPGNAYTKELMDSVLQLKRNGF